MTKIALALIMSVASSFLTGGAYAQDDQKNMKSLMVQSLSVYGRQLYNRGNYPEAANVYARILTTDQDNEQALQYLKDIKQKGYPVDEALLTQISMHKQKAAVIEAPKPKAVIAPAGTRPPKPVKAVESKKLPAPKESVAIPVINDNLDQDLADLQKDLKALRETLRTKSQQIQTLEKQLPPSL